MFDRDSGQVFKEYVLPPPPPAYISGRDWSRRTQRPGWKGRSGKGIKGPRSLVEISMHVVAENVGFLSEDHFSRRGVSVKLLRRIWTLLENRGTCLQGWKVLSKILLAETDQEGTLDLYRFRHHICRPVESLSHYTKPLESASLDFLSYINIGGFCSFDTHELMALSDLRNLVVLEIIQPSDEMRAVFPRTTDRLVRGWSEKTDPFPLLRVLRIWGDESTSENSLQYLGAFPSLMLYDVNGARSAWENIDSMAPQNGWKVAEPLQGLQDSLLWYLMLFSPMNEDNPAKLRDIARNIDEGLINFCLDDSRSIGVVPAQDAPPMMQHIEDAAKSSLPMYLDGPTGSSQACKTFPFETWAFFLASCLGQATNDSDLQQNGAAPKQQTVAEKLILPSKPMACLQLGHCGRAGISPAVAYVRRGLFATARYTLHKMPAGKATAGTADQRTANFMKPEAQFSSVETGLRLNRKKRRRMDDILQSFTRS
ncbi:hypothetical protein F5X68DRAFT_157007 [Plectosphaerella plurivora]|uniref:Cbs domain-containing protein n=1 Tax=Plectosphaerella plurivora TaxID=936078 RepID=A0A9P8V5S0_9PEZI|nr:hypothetical protein F5X68DRAFT_157007 [Plectosphaerella plurivora]